MNTGPTVLSQLLQYLSRYEFNRCVQRYGGNHRYRTFPCWSQFVCMAYAQLTGRDSLRDIVLALNAHPERLYHLGLRTRVARSTLADTNERRDFRIYQDVAQHLIQQARVLYQGDALAVELDQTVYALDSTTIDLCLSMFPWAEFRTTKGAVKLHTLLDLRGAIPRFATISTGKLHDVNVLDVVPLTAGDIVVMDRAYLDFKRLHRLTRRAVFFVTRAKRNLRYRRVGSVPVEIATGVRADQSIVLRSLPSRTAYPEHLRRVSYVDPATGKRLVFLTNHFTLPAAMVAALYRNRWRVELFFKWIKQHLRLKAFYGTSPNAVKTQIWIAISLYLLVAIARQRLGIAASLHTLLHLLEVNAFEKLPIPQLVMNALDQNPMSGITTH